jgi:hypothetical protein
MVVVSTLAFVFDVVEVIVDLIIIMSSEGIEWFSRVLFELTLDHENL